MAEELTIGYWKIRGLAASLRMMCGYAGTPYVNKAYGEDAMQVRAFMPLRSAMPPHSHCQAHPSHCRNGLGRTSRSWRRRTA